MASYRVVLTSSAEKELKGLSAQTQRAHRSPLGKSGRQSPPAGLHQHWHIDVSYLNVCATFYYLCSILDGYSGEGTAEESPPACRVTDEVDYFRLGDFIKT